MDPTSIDLRSISCKGIRSFNLFQKPSTFAIFTLIDPSNPNGKQKQPTAADPDGGEDPEWDERFRFYLDGRDLALEVEIMVHGNIPLLLGERVVGRAHVQIADLLAEGADGSVRHVSYQVVGTDGKPNGLIRFSYNFNYPAPAVSLPAAGYCPPVVPSPAGNYYPPPSQLYPLISPPATDCYPPPRQQEPVMAFPAESCYPLPYQQGWENQSMAAAGRYSLPHQQESAVSYPLPSRADAGRYPPPGVHVAYPRTSAAPECCYPPPRPACCYPAPPEYDGYGWG